MAKGKGGVHHGKLPSPKGHSSVQTDSQGIPLAEPPKHKSLLGLKEPPDTQGKSHLKKEKYLGQVEILMLKGVIHPNAVATTLGITFTTAKKYMEAIEYRWLQRGAPQRQTKVRGEAKSRLDLINTELWAMYSNTDDIDRRARIMQQILNTHDRQMIVDGLTPTALVLLNSGHTQDINGSNVVDKIQNHKKMLSLVSELDKFISVSGDSSGFEEIEEGEFTEG